MLTTALWIQPYRKFLTFLIAHPTKSSQCREKDVVGDRVRGLLTEVQIGDICNPSLVHGWSYSVIEGKIPPPPCWSGKTCPMWSGAGCLEILFCLPCINCIWRPVATRVPEMSILGPVLFNPFINKLDHRAECDLCKGTQSLGRVADTPEGHVVISHGFHLAGEMGWQELHKLQQWQVYGPGQEQSSSVSLQ